MAEFLLDNVHFVLRTFCVHCDLKIPFGGTIEHTKEEHSFQSGHLHFLSKRKTTFWIMPNFGKGEIFVGFEINALQCVRTKSWF